MNGHPAAPRAARRSDTPVASGDEHVRQPDQRHRDAAARLAQGVGELAEVLVKLTPAPVADTSLGQRRHRGVNVDPRNRGADLRGDPVTDDIDAVSDPHVKSGRRIVLR